YQDTNRLQEAILLALKPDGRGLTVVGDDAQSIYSFRAAEVQNILGFPRRFEPPARVIALERNYRSTQPILEASNAVIALAREPAQPAGRFSGRAAGAGDRRGDREARPRCDGCGARSGRRAAALRPARRSAPRLGPADRAARNLGRTGRRVARGPAPREPL